MARYTIAYGTLRDRPKGAAPPIEVTPARGAYTQVLGINLKTSA